MVEQVLPDSGRAGLVEGDGGQHSAVSGKEEITVHGRVRAYDERYR